MRNTTHLRELSGTKTICGRPAKGGRVHRDWPLCKNCQRVLRARGGSWFVQWGADGWSLPSASHATTTTSASNAIVHWIKRAA